MEPGSNPEDADDPVVVAIDGPAGSGKSTVAKLVAAQSDLEYLDTGAMYRAVTHAALCRKVDPSDAEAVAEVAQNCEIVQRADGSVWIDGVDATAEIRSDLVSSNVSAVSSHKGVRSELVSRQREWVRSRGGAVVDGRDMATVVFPNALVKVYLTASAEVRASRRTLEHEGADYERVLADMTRRDMLDSERKHDPLRQADDAHLVDTSDLTIDMVVDRICELIKSARAGEFSEQ